MVLSEINLMQQKIDSAVVILFNPENSVFDNIVTYVHHVKSLYVVDNSTMKHTLNKRLLSFKNVKIIHTGGNIGISKALNMGLEYAYHENHKWLMTLDQDTSFDPKDIDLFFDSFYKINNNKIALVSPLHNKKSIKTHLENPFIEKEVVMTSANIVNVKIAKEVGAYNERFFIDEVDHEFCFKLQKNSYKVLQNASIAVNHTLGTQYKYNSGIKLYSSMRLYYMMRNYLYLKKNYYQEHVSFFKQRDKYLLKFFINQIIYGDHRLQNIKMMIKGILDYKSNTYGKMT